MSLENIRRKLADSDFFRDVSAASVSSDHTTALHLKNIVGSLPAFLVADLSERTGRPICCLAVKTDTAAYLLSDLEQVMAGGTEGVPLFFPPTGDRPYDEDHVTDLGPLVQRANVLKQLQQGRKTITVTSVEAILERVPPPETVQQEATHLETGQEVGLQKLVERLTEKGFEIVDFVEQPGEMTLRGGIVDVFPFAGDYPIRIEFFGDEIDSLREFDPRTQRSLSRLTTTSIIPRLEGTNRFQAEHHSSFLSYVPQDTILVLFDEDDFYSYADDQFAAVTSAFKSENGRTQRVAVPPGNLYLDGAALRKEISNYFRLLIGNLSSAIDGPSKVFDARPQPAFNSNMALVKKQIAQNTTRQIRTTILCDSHSQCARLEELLGESTAALQYEMKVESLHEGFEVSSLKLAVYTDHQIFNRYHRPTSRRRKAQMGGLSIRELRQLVPGDFVTHIDYGIGRFAGMEHITVRGKQQEAVRLFFRDDDLLYVNVSALHKLHKYSGKDGQQPKLTKLGTGEWERIKARTKKRVKDIARDLIRLYAERRSSQGFAFSPDSVWQRELEASFQFEDTPDQAAAWEAVKYDMEQPTPMDRLICGDVGFGKTEIAVRAAFKAVQDGKQVAVLVPTTILAAQHLETFRQRMAPFPVKIDVLSRFRSVRDKKDIAKQLAKGEIDVLIGTHALVSKDISFKTIGLLVIDEEQRFGVSVKERLRKLRVDIDTLTLTATPIPRTLQFSLMGARDLSIINTPPPNRQPIVTEIHAFNKNLVRDAILYEANRGGQVFFINNRVQTIDEVAATLRMLVPNIRIEVAHGQMKGSDLERIMLAFLKKKFEVLVCTNIIESGLDIANANTMIIDRADRFGLADLHQLRGRVGRSDRKAFCYLLTPSVQSLTREARQRLQAVEQFSDLGSGFQIAMRDLDIRGAGNLLGAEQTGFIEDVGFDTYHKILDEAVRELRSEEFSELFPEKTAPPPVETLVDVEEDAYIPDDYVSNSVERLNIYRRISNLQEHHGIEEIREELNDRFGEIPPPVDSLLMAVNIKLFMQQWRLPKVLFKNQRLFLEFPDSEKDPYFYDQLFQPLLEGLNRLQQRLVLKDQKSKLRAIIQDVSDLRIALNIARTLELPLAEPAAA